jgi:hypothetical protein
MCLTLKPVVTLEASQDLHVCVHKSCMCVCLHAHCTQVPVTFIYGEHDWMNPATGVAVAEILDKIRERKVRLSVSGKWECV